MYNPGFASVLLSLPQKELCNIGSNPINQGSNINAEAKYEVEMQTPIDDSNIFTEVSRSAQASPSSCWSPPARTPRKGQAPSWVTPWIASGLPHV